MTRQWLVGGLAAALALAAVLALVVGGVVGRSIITTEDQAPSRPETVRFTDTLTDVSLAYPATWRTFTPKDQAVRLLAASPDASASVKISVRKSGLEPVSDETLPVVRPLVDDLLAKDTRITALAEPSTVSMGGLPGYRYRYTFRPDAGGDGGHVHYFLFKDGRIIQIVLQAVPAAQLTTLQPVFDRIAASFQGSRR